MWVLNRKCDTCIYRPGNLMHLNDGRRDSMAAKAVANQTVISCHETLDGARSVCRGFYDVHGRQILALVLARSLRVLKFDDPPHE